jgi:hypothetical protein
MAMDAALVHIYLDPNSPKAQVFYKMGGSSNQSVDSTTPRPSGNITYSSHLCPFNLPTSSLSTILGHDKAIVFLSLMVLVSHILKRAKLHLQRKKKKKNKVTQPVGYSIAVLPHLDLSLSSLSLTFPSSLLRFCSLIVRLLTLPSSPLILHSRFKIMLEYFKAKIIISGVFVKICEYL